MAHPNQERVRANARRRAVRMGQHPAYRRSGLVESESCSKCRRGLHREPDGPQPGRCVMARPTQNVTPVLIAQTRGPGPSNVQLGRALTRPFPVSSIQTANLKQLARFADIDLIARTCRDSLESDAAKAHAGCHHRPGPPVGALAVASCGLGQTRPTPPKAPNPIGPACCGWHFGRDTITPTG